MPGALPYTMAPVAGATPQRESGAAAAAAPAAIVAGNIDLRFFVWLVIVGIILPVLVLGGLKVGKFQFVYRKG